MTHWIVETMIYEVKTLGVVNKRIECVHRLGRSDLPGVWLVRGEVELDRDDSFETRDTVVDLDEFVKRTRRMQDYSLVLRQPCYFAPPFPRSRRDRAAMTAPKKEAE